MNVFSEKKVHVIYPKILWVFNKEFKNKNKNGKVDKNGTNLWCLFDNNNHTILQLTNYISLK